MRVGVIGLGLMGSAMAANLVKAGYETLGHDISAARRDAARSDGVSVVDDVAELLRAAPDAIILSLPSAAALAETGRLIASRGGGSADGTVLIETSTLSLQSKLDFAAAVRPAGFVALDCPLSGGAVQARSVAITVFASGEPDALERAMPLLRAVSRNQVLAGDYGSGTKLKLIANHLIAINNLATAEALLLASRAGLDLKAIVPAISASSATSVCFDGRGPLIADRAWSDPARQTATLAIPLKDNELIDALAREFAAPTPLLDATRSVYRAAIAQGRGQDDPAALFAVLEQLCAAGQPRTTQA